MTLYREIFEIPTLTPSLNVLTRMHHRDLLKLKCLLGWEIKTAGLKRIPPAPLMRARVTVTRRAVRELDLDNLRGGVKPLIDVLCRPVFLKAQKAGGTSHIRHAMGLSIIDDDNPSVLDLVVNQVRCKTKAQGTQILIEELPL